MQTTKNPDTPPPDEMRRMIAALTPDERALLNDPKFLTEDEADIITSERSLKESGPLVSLDELFRENGQTRRKRRA